MFIYIIFASFGFTVVILVSFIFSVEKAYEIIFFR